MAPPRAARSRPNPPRFRAFPPRKSRARARATQPDTHTHTHTEGQTCTENICTVAQKIYEEDLLRRRMRRRRTKDDDDRGDGPTSGRAVESTNC